MIRLNQLSGTSPAFPWALLAVMVGIAALTAGCGPSATGDLEAVSEPASDAAVESPAGTAPLAETTEAAPASEPVAAPASAPKQPPKAVAQTPKPAPASAPAPVPVVETVTVPEGTILSVVFDGELSSETSMVEDPFTVRVVSPVDVEGTAAIAEGDTISGRVVQAISTKKIGGAARLDLEFNELRLSSGTSVPFSAVFLAEGKKQTKKDAATIGGATVGGAILGRVIGHQKDEDAKGTTIGAAVGAAVGTAIAARNETDPVVLATGTIVEIRLDAPVVIERSR